MLLRSQQKELGEVKEMLKALMQFSLSQQQNSMRASEEAETDRDDAKVQMQLLQKSTTSHISKAVKEMQKSCSIFSCVWCWNFEEVSSNHLLANYYEENLSFEFSRVFVCLLFLASYPLPLRPVGVFLRKTKDQPKT